VSSGPPSTGISIRHVIPVSTIPEFGCLPHFRALSRVLSSGGQEETSSNQDSNRSQNSNYEIATHNSCIIPKGLSSPLLLFECLIGA
jgi:hypothetical protein